MRAVVLSIGSELLRGDIVDTNAAFLARELSHLGFRVQGVHQIGDDLETLGDVFLASLQTADLIISTGGLGPTQDDLTREAIASAMNEEMYEREDLLHELASRFQAMGRRMPDRNRKQATLIPSAEAIPNPNGTAPGWLVRREGRLIAAMPGPPGEMRPMWQKSVRPQLEALLPGAITMLSLMTFGLGESAVEERIDDVITWHHDVVVATYAKENGVEVHVTVHSADKSTGSILVQEAEEKLRQRLGRAIYGYGGDTLSSVVVNALKQRALTIAAMESCTGGAVASMLTDTTGSSECFRGGVIAYTQEAKARYGVSLSVMEQFGLVSQETATSMARAAREQLNTDIGIGVTGVAGAEPIEGRPPGTAFVALSSDGGEHVREIHRPGERPWVKRFVAQCALDLVRRHLDGAMRPFE